MMSGVMASDESPYLRPRRRLLMWQAAAYIVERQAIADVPAKEVQFVFSEVVLVHYFGKPLARKRHLEAVLN